MLKQILCLFAVTVAYAQSSPPVPPKQNVIERVSAATVFIKTDNGSGTGFIVSGDGTIVTANHVIAEAKKVACKTGAGEVFDQVSLLARDERRDIAILKVAGFGLPAVEFADLSRVEPGQHMFVIGNPLGKEELKATVTDGVVSGMRDFGWGYRVLQVSAPISPGNSGGPVITDDGKVLGVASFKAVAGESLSFATPIDYVRGLLASGSDSKPLRTWDTSPADSPFKTTEVAGLTDYWKSTRGPTFYVSDSGKEISIVNLSDDRYTYDVKWVQGYVIGVMHYYGAKSFCALKKIDETHLHSVCFGYKKEYDDARVIAEAERRLYKPNDVWVRIR